MLQVIVTRGLRGTEVYRAIDREAAEKTVRHIIASAIRDDKTTTFERIDKDRADAWRIRTGKYVGDVIQIASVTGDSKTAAYYNMAATVSVLSRQTDKGQERDRALKTMPLALDTATNMKRADKRARNMGTNGQLNFPCMACHGTGKEKKSSELGFVLLPNAERTRAYEYRKFEILTLDCPACNGKGERE